MLVEGFREDEITVECNTFLCQYFDNCMSQIILPIDNIRMDL
jgi:hypothetical protein